MEKGWRVANLGEKGKKFERGGKVKFIVPASLISFLDREVPFNQFTI